MVAEPVLYLDGMPVSAPVITERSVVEWSCVVPAGATAQLSIDDTLLEPFLRPGESLWRWRWQAPAVAGEYALRWAIFGPTGQLEIHDVVRVAPSLLDARRYAALLADLAQLAPGLVYALRGGRLAAGGSEAGQPDQAAVLALLTGPATRRLLAAIDRLARRPRRQRLQPDGPRELGAWRERPDPARWRIAADAVPLPGTGWPDRVWLMTDRPDPHERSRQMAALLLDQLITAGQWLLTLTLPAVKRAQLVAAMNRLRVSRAALEVPATMRLAGIWSPRGRDEQIIYAYRRLLQRRSVVGWDPALLTIPVREVARLYEIWCAAQVAQALLALSDWRLCTQSVLTEQGLRFLPDQPVLTLAHVDGATLTMRYQPRYAPDHQPFRSLDDRVRIPDLALELTNGQQSPLLIVLDAKYRSEEGELPASALDEGYSYLAGIGRADGQRAVNALLLIFPATGKPVTYASRLTVMPLMPGEPTTMLHQWLREQITVALT